MPDKTRVPEAIVDLPIEPNASAKDILAEEHLGRYQKSMAFLARELRKLYVNIYLIEKLVQFPLMLFTEDIPDRAIFLSYFIDNAISKSILIITNLTANRTSKGKDIYSLTTFQLDMLSFVKPEYKAAFRARRKRE
jgi:hypothetical protein